MKSETERLIAEASKDFVPDVDGFVYFWPERLNGHLSARQLRIIADELDRRNAPWEKVISDYFNDIH